MAGAIMVKHFKHSSCFHMRFNINKMCRRVASPMCPLKRKEGACIEYHLGACGAQQLDYVKQFPIREKGKYLLTMKKWGTDEASKGQGAPSLADRSVKRSERKEWKKERSCQSGTQWGGWGGPGASRGGGGFRYFIGFAAGPTPRTPQSSLANARTNSS